ncbi:MAG: chromosomal replication initiator protein DnaA, partial [Armatimonadota bacterium]|nr:chromosomal replication initiator protein DnaA [Armatimonadota bacterium]
SETPGRSARGITPEAIRSKLVEQLNCTPMNPKHRFSTFVPGQSNEFVQKAAYCVAESPGKAYNPLFIHGGVGLGKTHILQAIGQEIQERQPDAIVACLSGEAFTSSFVAAVRERRMDEFRRAYRHVDVWLVDDVQFIASKERTGEEFYHQFNTLHGMDRQVVICSDRPPQELQILDNRMASRFEAGLVADMCQPNYETRLAILRQKTETEGTPIPPEVLEMMAKMIRSSVRVLEGALIRILAHASFTSSTINLSMASSLLSRYFDEGDRAPIRVETVQRVVCDSLDVPLEGLLSKKRDKRSLMARQMAMYLSRDLTDCSLEQIGQLFGGKDHSTVAHACRTFKNSLPLDSNLERTTERIRDRIRRAKS